MADDSKTTLVVEVEGKAQFTKDTEEISGALGDAAKAAGEFETKANDADDALSKLAEDSDPSTRTFNANVSAAKDKAVADFLEVITVVLKVNEAIIASVNQTAEMGDAIAKGAKEINFSTDAYQRWDFILSKNNSSISKAKSAIENLTKAAGTGSDKQVAAFEAIGLSMEQVHDMQPEELFASVVQGLQNIEDEQQRAALASSLFGGSYKSLGTLLNSTGEETASLSELADKLQAIMSDEAVQSASEYQDSMENLNTAIDGVKRNLTVGLMPAITEARNGLTDMLLNDIDWDTVTEKLSGLFTGALDAAKWLVDNGETLAAMIGTVGAAWLAWKGTETVMKTLDSARQLWTVLEKIGGLLGVSGGMAAAGIGLVALGVNAYANEAKTIETIGKLGDGHSLQEYAANVGVFEAAIAKWHETYDEYIASGYTEGIDQIMTELQHYQIGLSHATEEYEKALAAQSEAEETAAAQLPETGEQAAETAEQLTETAETMQSNVESMLEQLPATTGEIVSEFESGADEMSQAAADAVQSTNDSMATNMATLSSNAYVWGSDMMLSLAQGILDGAISFVIPAIESVADDIDSYIGFSEPERGPLADFHTFAPDMMALFAQGIRDGRGLLASAIGESFDLGPLIAAQNAGQSFNYGGVNVTIYGAEGQSAEELYEVFSYRLQRDVVEREAAWR